MNHLTTCSPPVPRPVPFGSRRSTCSLSPSLRGQEQVRPVPRPVPQGGDSTTTHPITPTRKDTPMTNQPSIHDRLEAATGLNGDTLRGQLADQGLTVVVDETITDRAAIRDSDEPSERGDFPCCSGARAAGDSVGALDLDAIEARAEKAMRTGDVGLIYATTTDDVPALIAEVRSLRAKVAAVRSLRAKVAAVEALADRWQKYADTLDPTSVKGAASIASIAVMKGSYEGCAEKIRAALATTGEVQ